MAANSGVSVKETGSARVYSRLRQDILRTTLPPGAPLDEIGLSERFGLSRSPIREALVRLSSEGLVQILPNRSTIVTPIDIQGIPEFLDALDLMQRVTTRSAAMFRTAAQLAEIEAAERRYAEGARQSIETGDSLPLIEANYAFHMAIADASANRYFVGFYRRLLDDGRRILHYHFEYERNDPQISVARLTSEHTEMLAAIRSRDADGAERIAHAHAVQFKGRFMQYLSRSITSDVRLDLDDRVSAPI
jgi:DNA-binding GntR family transcriptional regulator